MAYKTIKKKTYNNVMYLANIIKKEKGYPIREAAQIALDNFYDFDGSFQWVNIETMINNLVTFEESKRREILHNINMLGSY